MDTYVHVMELLQRAGTFLCYINDNPILKKDTALWA
jgi:hypothetical protein